MVVNEQVFSLPIFPLAELHLDFVDLGVSEWVMMSVGKARSRDSLFTVLWPHRHSDATQMPLAHHPQKKFCCVFSSTALPEHSPRKISLNDFVLQQNEN